jgi:hypothetical protein
MMKMVVVVDTLQIGQCPEDHDITPRKRSIKQGQKEGNNGQEEEVEGKEEYTVGVMGRQQREMASPLDCPARASTHQCGNHVGLMGPHPRKMASPPDSQHCGDMPAKGNGKLTKQHMRRWDHAAHSACSNREQHMQCGVIRLTQ